MYTNGNVGNTFDQYKISYILFCVTILVMQEVNITCPVFMCTLIISVKRDLLCFAECCCGPVGCTMAPEDLEDRPPTTAGFVDCRSKQCMSTSVGVGSYAAIAYDKRWYVAKVTDVQDGVFGASYTTPCRGQWKWDRTDNQEVEESDSIMTLSDPCAVGNLFQAKAEEKYVVDRLFSSISVDPQTSCKHDRGRANTDV